MKLHRLLFVLVLICNQLHAQIDTTVLVKATDFSIPSSPAFVLLGTNPTSVNRPGFTKDFKVDYILNEGNIVSDLALDFNPVWMFFFDKMDIEQYRKTSEFARLLSTSNLSLGTTELDNQKKLAYSITFNVLRIDPIMDSDYSKGLSEILSISDEQKKYNISRNDSIIKAKLEIKKIENELSQGNLTPGERLEKQKEIESLNIYIDWCKKEIDDYNIVVNKIDNERLEKFNKDYLNKNWSKPNLAIGFGEVYNYDSPAIDSLKFQNKGFGIWINGSIGFNPLNLFRNTDNKIKDSQNKAILSAMIKNIHVESSNIQFYGLNLRYGSNQTNFFVESTYENNDGKERYVIAYGGEYRIDLKKTIEFSLKTDYDNDFTLKQLVPSIKLNLALSKDPFK